MPSIVTGADDIYRKYHVDKDDERLELFSGLHECYAARTALYPGSFVHVTPSFVIPTVVYSDSDRRATRFFADPGALDLVRRMKRYEQEPAIRFHAGNYERAIDEPDESFDLLISQYAGFISRACKRYLRVGGHLVVNNIHGDASMAALDPDYALAAVYRRRGQHFTFSADDLDTYMIPKDGVALSRGQLEMTMRGPAFTRQVAGYVFERIR